MVGSLHVPAGKYTLVTLPISRYVATGILCKHTGQWGTDRFEVEDLGKTPMMRGRHARTAGADVDQLRENLRAGSTQLHIRWENDRRLGARVRDVVRVIPTCKASWFLRFV